MEYVSDMKVESGKYSYRIAWLGYPPEEDTWEEEANLDKCRDVLHDFYERQAKGLPDPRRKIVEPNSPEWAAYRNTTASDPGFSSESSSSSISLKLRVGSVQASRVRKSSPYGSGKNLNCLVELCPAKFYSVSNRNKHIRNKHTEEERNALVASGYWGLSQ